MGKGGTVHNLAMTGGMRRCLVAVAIAVPSVAVCGAGLWPSAPARHKPIVTMGRDCWRVLNKYTAYGWGGSLIGFDNPELNADPALADVAHCYVAAAEPPPASAGLAVWPHLGDYFRKGAPDREILTSNPDPDRPFFLYRRSERSPSTFGSPVKLDIDEYRTWRKAHPNLMADGYCGEWCNDLNGVWRLVEGGTSRFMKSPDSREREEALRRFMGERPKTRYEHYELVKRFYEMRKERNFGGKMAILDGTYNSLHVAADLGASLICFETTASGQQLQQVTAMFTRGASRQFGVPWEWYIANYAYSWGTNGMFVADSCCRYPASPRETGKYPKRGRIAPAPQYLNLPPEDGYPHGKWMIGYGGQEFGISRSLFRRTHYMAYLSGANYIMLEEWMGILKMWDMEKGKTVFSPRGRIYADFAGFMRKNPDRGTHYSPVAVCVPLAQGYAAAGGCPWGNPKYGYTDGDKAVDAVFFTLVPGVCWLDGLKKGEEACFRNTPYADMYDVIAPDAKSQTPDQVLDVMKSYRALVVAGDYVDHGWEKSLAKFESDGGKVVRVDASMMKDEVKTGKGRGINRGEIRYPKIDAVFNALQDEFFPFKVEGRCMYGLSVADDHLWLYAANNDGVTKFGDAPQVLDESKASDIRVSPRSFAPRFGKVAELISGKTVATDGGAFSWRIGPGDIAVFEFSRKR